MTQSTSPIKSGTKSPAKETLLTPRFYTTDFQEMAAMDISSNDVRFFVLSNKN